MLSKDDVDYCINFGDKEASLIYNSVQLGSLITYYLHELGIYVPGYDIIKDACEKYGYTFKHYDDTIKLYKEDLTLLECLTLITIICKSAKI